MKFAEETRRFQPPMHHHAATAPHNPTRHDESQNRWVQSDVKLKRAEEQNKQLGAELEAIKEKVKSLEGRDDKKKMANDLLGDLSRIFDDEKSFVGGNGPLNNFGLDMMPAEGDLAMEYEFKIGILTQELQAAQAENNTLVQTVLGLKQEYREKKSQHDEVSTKLVVQECNELRRELREAEETRQKVEVEIAEIRARFAKHSEAIRNRTHNPSNEAEVRAAIDQLEKGYRALATQLNELKASNLKKQNFLEDEKRKRNSMRASSFIKMEEQNNLVIQLRAKKEVLQTKLRDLKSLSLNQSNISQRDTAAIMPEHVVALRQTNDRLLNEILRLNKVIEEQKTQQAERSRMRESFSQSQIQFNDQSMNQSFLSKFN